MDALLNYYLQTIFSNTLKIYTFRWFFFRFLIFFINVRYQLYFKRGKHVFGLSGFRDLVTADGEHIRAGMVIIIVVFPIQTGVEFSAQMIVTPFKMLTKEKKSSCVQPRRRLQVLPLVSEPLYGTTCYTLYEHVISKYDHVCINSSPIVCEKGNAMDYLESVHLPLSIAWDK